MEPAYPWIVNYLVSRAGSESSPSHATLAIPYAVARWILIDLQGTEETGRLGEVS